MCSPFAMGAISLIGSLASTGMSMMAQQRAQREQEQANAAWRAEQERQRSMENSRQEELRQRAEISRSEGVEEIAAPKQQEAQKVEATRLNENLVANVENPEGAGDQLLAGSALGGQEFKTDMAKRLNTASQEARQRIASLANMQSYGGSFGGLQNRNAEVLQTSDQGINLANNMRQGSMAAYGIAKGVNPPQIQPQSDPWSGIGTALAGIAGKGFGMA